MLAQQRLDRNPEAAPGLGSSPAVEGRMAAWPSRGVKLVKPSMGKGLGQGVWFRGVTLCLQTDAGSQAQELVPSVWAVEGTRLSCSQLWTALWLLLAAVLLQWAALYQAARVPRRQEPRWKLPPSPQPVPSTRSSEMQASKYVLASALTGLTSATRR